MIDKLTSHSLSVLLFCSAVPLLPAALPAQTTADPALLQLLRAKDQRLLEAVHDGDRDAWAQATAPDFVYIEEGSVTPRVEFLKELEADGGATLRISTYELHRFGDTALVLHHDSIPATPGVVVHRGGEYLMSETWQKLNGTWKLHLVHVDSVRTDPPATALTSAEIDDLVGTYRIGGVTKVLHREGNRLIASRSGQPDTELLPETRDVFFVAGETRMRQVFQRNAAGVVTGVVTRDENSDRLWTRDPPPR